MATGDAGELVTYARTELLARIRGCRAASLAREPVPEQASRRGDRLRGGAGCASERRLLTALVASSVLARVLDPGALETLLDSGFELCSVPNLHAKLSLTDTSWGLVGSGNLTNAGLGSEGRANVELGVNLDAEQIASAAELFARWSGWRRSDRRRPDRRIRGVAASSNWRPVNLATTARRSGSACRRASRRSWPRTS